jgi:hypothetical protein
MRAPLSAPQAQQARAARGIVAAAPPRCCFAPQLPGLLTGGPSCGPHDPPGRSCSSRTQRQQRQQWQQRHEPRRCVAAAASAGDQLGGDATGARAALAHAASQVDAFVRFTR